MDDGLVDRRARRAEIGKFRLRAVALQDVLRRNRLCGALIGDGALDDRPIDATRPAFRRFAFGRRRRRDILEAAIDHRLEGIKLRRRLVAPAIAPAAIAVAAFAEGLAALAGPRPAITIAPLAIATFPVAGLTFTPLAAPLTIAARTLAPPVVMAGAIAALTIAVASLTATLITRALITGTAAARAALAALLLLLCALARGGRGSLAAWRRSTFGTHAAATPPTTAWTIARRQCRQGELAARGNRFDTQASRRLLSSGLVAFDSKFRGRCFMRCSGCRRRIRRGAFRLRAVATAAPSTAPGWIARQMQCA